jgi:AcrR family transcriptional regulator
MAQTDGERGSPMADSEATIDLKSNLPPRGVPRSTTRDRLIEAAVELFGANGFNETSMRDLATEVGIKAPALYNHFHSKEEIFIEAITVTLGDFHSEVTTRDDPNLPSLERLENMVSRHVIYQIDHARTAKANDRLIESSAMDHLNHEQREAIRSMLRKYLDTMTDICTQVVRDAGREPKDVRLVALAIGSMCDKVLSWYRPNGRYPKQKIAAHFCKLARSMLEAE